MTNWVVGGDDEGLNIFFVIEDDQVGCKWWIETSDNDERLNIEKWTFFVIEYDQVGCWWWTETSGKHEFLRRGSRHEHSWLIGRNVQCSLIQYEYQQRFVFCDLEFGHP